MRLLAFSACGRRRQGMGFAPFDVSSFTVSEPKIVCELDTNLLKGDIHRLSWSPEATSIHIQTIDGDRRLRDYIVTMPDGVVSIAFGEPEWAAAYWARKSDLSAPGRRDVAPRSDAEQPTDPSHRRSAADLPTAARRHPTRRTRSMRTKRRSRSVCWGKRSATGSTASQWLVKRTGGVRPAAGRSCSSDGKRIALMDQKKNKKTIAAAKGATMPAWSNDGSRIVFLQKAGRKQVPLDVGERHPATGVTFKASASSCYSLRVHGLPADGRAGAAAPDRARVRGNRNPSARPGVGSRISTFRPS